MTLISYLEKGVGTVKGGTFRSHSFKFALHSGQDSGNVPNAKIFCLQCSTQITSAEFSDIFPGILASNPVKRYFLNAHVFLALKKWKVITRHCPKNLQLSWPGSGPNSGDLNSWSKVKPQCFCMLSKVPCNTAELSEGSQLPCFGR